MSLSQRGFYPDERTRDRIARGRRLLAENDELSGSADLEVTPFIRWLQAGTAAGPAPPPPIAAARRAGCSAQSCELMCTQNFLEMAEMSAQLHRALLQEDDSCSPRAGLSQREMQQALVTLLCGARRKFEACFLLHWVDNKCNNATIDAVRGPRLACGFHS